MKVGDKVVIINAAGRDHHFFGRKGSIRKPCGDGWILDITPDYWWEEKQLRLQYCQCDVKNCLTHHPIRYIKKT